MDYDKTNIACHFVEYRIDLPSVKYNIQLGCLSFRCSLQISKKTQENSCTGVSFYSNKLKETPAQTFSGGFYENFQFVIFTEHLQLTVCILKKKWSQCCSFLFLESFFHSFYSVIKNTLPDLQRNYRSTLKIQCCSCK